MNQLNEKNRPVIGLNDENDQRGEQLQKVIKYETEMDVMLYR